MTNVRSLSPPEWCGTDPARVNDPALCESFYATYSSNGQEVYGQCYHDGSRCKLGVGVTCSPPPPPPPTVVPHAEWTSLWSIEKAPLEADFLNRCKDTCHETAGCVGFVETGCDQAGCTSCELKSATSAPSYVVPAPQTYLWVGSTSRASKIAEADATSFDTYPYDDVAAMKVDEGAAPLEADRLSFTPAEFAMVVSVTLLSGVLLGGALALVCFLGKAWLRRAPHKAQPTVPLPPHYFEKGIPVKPEPSSESTASSEQSAGPCVSGSV